MANVKFRFKDDVKNRLIEAIEKGATYVLACNYAGIAPQTFNTWMRRGEEQLENEEKGDAFLELYLRVKRAEGVAVQEWLRLIEEAAKNGNWQAAAWKLERRYPNEYGRYTPQKPPEDKDSNNDATDEERIARVVAIVDDARKRNAAKRS